MLKRTYTKKPVDQRFWIKVDIKGPNECWEWKAGCNKDGYGEFRNGNKNINAHRLAWELTNGKSAEGKVIRHTCDNPPCCNPNHLKDGTQKDNIQDCINKGRHKITNIRAKGEHNGNVKLTKEQVLEIRKLYLTGNYTQQRLADMFGVSQVQIGRIINNKSWKHI